MTTSQGKRVGCAYLCIVQPIPYAELVNILHALNSIVRRIWYRPYTTMHTVHDPRSMRPNIFTRKVRAR